MNLVITEPPLNPEPLRNDMNEVIFEDFGFNSCMRNTSSYFALQEYKLSNPLNTSFTSSCLVVDSGFSYSHITPFINNKCKHKSVIFTIIYIFLYLD